MPLSLSGAGLFGDQPGQGERGELPVIVASYPAFVVVPVSGQCRPVVPYDAVLHGPDDAGLVTVGVDQRRVNLVGGAGAGKRGADHRDGVVSPGNDWNAGVAVADVQF